MISTNDTGLYETVRMFRSHGMVRESDSESVKRTYREKYPDLNPEFIFAFPAYNVRSTEINAVMGREQLRRLDANNTIRTENLKTFLKHLNPERYRTDFRVEGSCNYALTLVIREADPEFRDRLERALRAAKVEYRRGTAGGGNQLRQPYARKRVGDREFENYPQVDHVHFYGYYIGNYPDLDSRKIVQLCELLNGLK